MNKKVFFSAMLVTLLALSLVFVSCDNGTTSDGGDGGGKKTSNPFKGTWTCPNYFSTTGTLTFTDDTWELVYSQTTSGTYDYSANPVILYYSQGTTPPHMGTVVINSDGTLTQDLGGAGAGGTGTLTFTKTSP
jgi:hypothetical protein